MGVLASQKRCKVLQATTCCHGRVIEDVLTKDGKWSGKVRCLECSVIFDDPYRGFK